MNKKFGLSPKLIITNFLILFVSLMVVIFISNRAFEKTLYQLIGNELQNYADETALEIDHYIFGCIEEIKIISQADVFEKKIPIKITQYLNEILLESSRFRLLLVVDENGDFVSSTNNGNDESIKPIIKILLKSSLLINLTSKKQSEVFYKDHIRLKEKFYPFVLTPLTDDTNLIIEGALIGVINTSFIEREVHRIDDRTIGQKAAYLVDDPGNVLISREPGVKLFSSLSDIEANPNLKELLEGDQTGFVEYLDHTGDKVIAGFSDLNEYGNNQGGDWSIISIAPVNEALEDVFRVRDKLLFLALIALILGGLVVYIFARRIVRPIELLARVSKRMSEGELETILKIESNDEIAELGETFNQMTKIIKEREERLKEYSIKLEQRNKELQDFTAIASHDLQEPLRKVTVFSDRLKEKNKHLDEVSLDYIDRMQKSTIRMQELIDDLLSYSKVETRPKPFEQVDLNRIVKDSLTNLESRIIHTKGIINVDDLPSIQADRSQLGQLFQNLIGNALKYHKTEISPILNIQGQHSGNGEITIVIEDNGIGFEEKYAERIFQPFQRLHGRNEYEGTGIGLAICKKIVDRHKGTITVKSIPGEGSTFIITFPEKQTPK